MPTSTTLLPSAWYQRAEGIALPTQVQSRIQRWCGSIWWARSHSAWGPRTRRIQCGQVAGNGSKKEGACNPCILQGGKGIVNIATLPGAETMCAAGWKGLEAMESGGGGMKWSGSDSSFCLSGADQDCGAKSLSHKLQVLQRPLRPRQVIYWIAQNPQPC
mmetsp:Transcript_49303/g.101739  ORF Transcript_49303/g.101739 Transcript_49303/m.101739 type:complete len:160 (+) Transcript_49303:117-596(+)